MERISVGHTNFVVELEVKMGLPLIRHEDFQPSRKEKNTHVYDTGMPCCGIRIYASTSNHHFEY